jgi:hypothetical protein
MGVDESAIVILAVPAFNSLSRDHFVLLKNDDRTYIALPFNSLSRDHVSKPLREIHVEEKLLSTPSLGITGKAPGVAPEPGGVILSTPSLGITRDHPRFYENPRDNVTILSTPSLGITTLPNITISWRKTIFQLPLSGSLLCAESM